MLGLRRVIEIANEYHEVIHIILYNSSDNNQQKKLELLVIIDGNESLIKRKLNELIPILEAETKKKVFIDFLHINELKNHVDKLRLFIENGVFLFSRKMIVKKKVLTKYALIVLDRPIPKNFLNEIKKEIEIIPLLDNIVIVPFDETTRLQYLLSRFNIQYSTIIGFWTKVDELKKLKNHLELSG